MTGVIIGRFMPPHNGHRYLWDFARSVVSRLYILVCTLEGEPIDGRLRYQWVRAMAPAARVVHVTERIPGAERGTAGAIKLWAAGIAHFVPEAVATVFASEDYGWELAEHLHARFMPVDPNRNNIPVSASAIRNDPFGHWRYIPREVRPFFVRHVAVHRNVALATALARDLDTVVVHSYRDFWEQRRNTQHPNEPHDLSDAELQLGTTSSARALAFHANRVLIHSTQNDADLASIERLDLLVADPADRIAANVSGVPRLAPGDVDPTAILERVRATFD